MISVPASPDAPHQASDKLYYKRFNFQSVPMEDYEIRDISNRRRHPIVVAVLSMQSLDSRAQLISGQLQVSLVNQGRALAEKVYLELQIPKAAIGTINSFIGDSESTNIDGVVYKTYKYYHRDAGGPLPIFPGTRKDIFDGNSRYLSLEVSSDLHRQAPSPAITCIVFSDGGDPQTTMVTLEEFIDSELARFIKNKALN